MEIKNWMRSMDQPNGNHEQRSPHITLGHIKEGDLIHLELKAQNNSENWHKMALIMDLLSGQGGIKDEISKSDKLFARLIGVAIVVFVVGSFAMWLATK